MPFRHVVQKRPGRSWAPRSRAWTTAPRCRCSPRGHLPSCRPREREEHSASDAASTYLLWLHVRQVNDDQLPERPRPKACRMCFTLLVPRALRFSPHATKRSGPLPMWLRASSLACISMPLSQEWTQLRGRRWIQIAEDRVDFSDNRGQARRPNSSHLASSSPRRIAAAHPLRRGTSRGPAAPG